MATSSLSADTSVYLTNEVQRAVIPMTIALSH